MPRKIEISHRTIVFTVTFLVLLWFLFQIKDLLFEVFLALLLMAILNPLVGKLSKYKIPRGVSVLFAYLVGIGIFSFAVGSLVPPLVEQSANFVVRLPDYIEASGLTRYFGESFLEEAVSQLGTIPSQVTKITISLLSNVLGVLTVLVFAFYFLIARDKLDEQLTFLFGDKKKAEVGKIIDTLEKKLGGWATAQLSLMLIVGVLTYIGLVLLGLPHALPLGILAGLLELVPYIGPIMAAIPAVIIGFGISPVMGFGVTALAFLIQQVENYVLVPKIMEKSVGVSPIITLLALSIGFRIAGITGMIISIPIVITIQVMTKPHFASK